MAARRPNERSSPITLELGASGIIGGDFNITPKTLRLYADFYDSSDRAGMARVYSDLKRLGHFCAPWNSSSPRWIKMALKVLKLPGGEGGVRPPYLMPSEDEFERFAQGLLRLGIPEIDEYAAKAS